MTFKIVVVFGFLLFLAFFFSQPVDLGRDPHRLFQIRNRSDSDRGGSSCRCAATTSRTSSSRCCEGRGLPQIDFTLIAFIAALAAIAGSGGLTNTPISNYTRDQGWGMGHHVGAIPSVFGGHGLSLSHVGSRV